MSKNKNISIKTKFVIISIFQILSILFIAYNITILSTLNDINKTKSTLSISIIYLKEKFNKFYDDTTYGDSDDVKKIKKLLYKKSKKLSIKNGGIYEIIDKLQIDTNNIKNINSIYKTTINSIDKSIFLDINTINSTLKDLKANFEKQQSNSIILAEFKIAGDKYLKDIENHIDSLENSTNNLNNTIEYFSFMVITILVSLSIFVSFFSIKIITTLSKNFKTTLSNLSNSNDEIQSLANILDNASTSLEKRLEKQSFNTELINDMTNETANANIKNRDNINIANSYVKENYDLSNIGREKVKELYLSMKDINISSKKISTIVSTIDDISFQTHLLALNASIESARAGEHGLGFGIVAEEVKVLADKSSEASKEISIIIDETIENIEQNHSYTKETDDIMVKILNKSNDSKTIVDEITKAINSQSGRISKIKETVNSMYAITEENFATAKESSQLAEELRSEIDMINSNLKRLSII
jgi:methyl-accepting chemotaxis protein